MNSPAPTELVATLIAGNSALDPELLKSTVAHIEKAGGNSVHTAWIEPSKAADIFCTGLTPEKLRATVSQHIAEKPVDFIVQNRSKRRKKLLLADMESTIIEQEMLDELASLVGCGDQVAAITRRAMNGEIDFAGALRERVAVLKGQPVSILDEVAKRITFMPGARALVTQMKERGATCWLVSGGFTCFVGPVAALLGFDEAYANILNVEDGIITGTVTEPVLDKNIKKALLERACVELNLSLDETLTVGDGANDIPMLSACNDGGGLGIAFRAKPNVRALVPNQVNHADLTALLYAQGESKGEGA